MRSMKNRKLHGSVLLTVVAVMSLLIIFLFGTLALATATNNRAHVNYSQAQTGITARTIVDTAFKTLGESKDFASAFNKLDASSGVMNIPLSLSGNASTGFGHINSLTAEHAGKKMYYNADTKTWKEYDVVKLTANVTMAGVTSQATAYVVKDPPSPGGGKGGGAGFVTTGGADFKCQSDLYGGSYLGLPELAVAQNYDYSYNGPAAGKTGYLSGKDFWFENTGSTIEADVVINGNMACDGSHKNQLSKIRFPGEGRGITIWGDWTFSTDFYSSLSYSCDLTYSDTLAFNKIPYIYVDGVARGEVKLGPSNDPSDTSEQFPCNVFVGGLDTYGNNTRLGGDIYLMNPDFDNKIKPVNAKNLYGWTSSVINKTVDANAQPHAGGNIYSKGNLEIGCNFEVDGDLVVEKNLVIDSGKSLTVKGKLVVGGNLKNNGTLNVTGGANSIYACAASGNDLQSGTATPKAGVANETVTYIAIKNSTVKYQYNQSTIPICWMDPREVDVTGITPYTENFNDYNNQPQSVTYYDLTGKDPVWDEMNNPEKKPEPKREKQAYNIQDFDRTAPTDSFPYIDNNANGKYDDGDTLITNPSDAYDYSGSAKYKGTATHSITDWTDANGSIYPAYAERDVILGLTKYNNPNYNPNYAEGDDINTKDAYLDTQVVRRMDEILNSVVNPYNNDALPATVAKIYEDILKDESKCKISSESASVSGVTATAKMSLNGNNVVTEYDNGGVKAFKGTKVLLDNTQFTNGASVMPDGTHSGKDSAVVFNPGTGTMLVVIRGNVSFDSGLNVVVDDSKGGKVYFYLEKNATFTINGGALTTTNYMGYIRSISKNGSNPLVINTLDENATNPIAAPGLFVFAAKNDADYSGWNLDFENTEYMAANIVSPNIRLKVAATSNSLTDGRDIIYNGSKVNSSYKMILGCCNAKETSFPNQFNVIYIPSGDGQQQVVNNDLNNWYKLLYYDEY